MKKLLLFIMLLCNYILFAVSFAWFADQWSSKIWVAWSDSNWIDNQAIDSLWIPDSYGNINNIHNLETKMIIWAIVILILYLFLIYLSFWLTKKIIAWTKISQNKFRKLGVMFILIPLLLFILVWVSTFTINFLFYSIHLINPLFLWVNWMLGLIWFLTTVILAIWVLLWIIFLIISSFKKIK